MEKQEIGRFYATSFDGRVIEFIVYNDNTMDCPYLDVYSFKKIELKPRFLMYDDKCYYKYNVPAAYYYGCSQLIGSYDIDEDLFLYLKERRMIRYSSEMAFFYGFSDTNGYDKNKYNHAGSPFKWAKKKGPILVKQKKDNLIK